MAYCGIDNQYQSFLPANTYYLLSHWKCIDLSRFETPKIRWEFQQYLNCSNENSFSYHPFNTWNYPYPGLCKILPLGRSSTTFPWYSKVPGKPLAVLFYPLSNCFYPYDFQQAMVAFFCHCSRDTLPNPHCSLLAGCQIRHDFKYYHSFSEHSCNGEISIL